MGKLNAATVTGRYLQGESVGAMAKEYGTSREAIYQHLRKREGWNDGRMREVFIERRTDREVGQAVKDTLAILDEDINCTIKQIAEEIGQTPATIRRVLKHMRTGGWTRHGDRNRGIIDKHLRGWSQSQIGDEYGLSQSRVHTILKGGVGSRPAETRGKEIAY